MAWRAGVFLVVLVIAGCGRAGTQVASPEPAPEAGTVDADAGSPALDAAMEAEVEAGSGPPYPIVLAHGFSGWDSIGPLEYFYQVPEALRGAGHDVYVSQVDPYADSYTRGAQLLGFVESVLARTGAAKVDVIGHSQGGLDARYVASNLPAHVAVVVTFATPHHGTGVADAVVSGTGGPDGGVQQSLDYLFGVPAADGGASPPGLLAAMNQMTTAGTDAFNQAVPDGPGVKYFSIAGRSNLLLGGAACQAAEPGFVAMWDPYVDPMRPELSASAALLTGDPAVPTLNDGLVQVSSTRWGTFLGCVPADHLDEIGQIAGQSPGPGNPFDYKAFYLALAGWLVAQGF